MINVIKQEHDTEMKYFKLQSGKWVAEIIIYCGQFPYINVVVHNATHKALRGAGNTFDNLEQALKHYKTSEIRSMIAYAVEGC